MKCSHSKRDCIDSRPENGYTRRRYQCLLCDERFTTIEVEVEAKKGVPMLKVLAQQYGTPIDIKQLGATIKNLAKLKNHLER